MYLLASDFDRTFYINNNDFKKNVEAVNKFMKKNIFAIVTGRSYDDFMNIAPNVNYHYLVVNHGATILKDGNVIGNYPIEENLVKELKKTIDFDNLEYFACQKTNSRVDINTKDITKINITFPDNLVAKRAVKYINDNFKDKLKAYILFHKNQIEIVSSKVNKKNAIKVICELEKIDYNSVYTVGDGYTDLEMISFFNGYAMEVSVDELKEVAIKTVKSVSEIIEFLDVDIIRPDNKEEVNKFINECFNYDEYFEKYMAKIYGDNASKTNKHIAIKKDNELVALALLIPNELIMEDKILSVLTIGSICVSKKYRKRGYFNLLMNEIEKEAKNYDISVLSGDIKRYKKYGYYPNLLSLYKIGSKNNEYEFRKMDGSKNLECINLYNNKFIHSNREDNFLDIATQWKSCAYYVFKNNNFEGYLIYNNKSDYVSEIACEDEIFAIQSFGYYKNLDYINVRVLNNDYNLLKKLENYECAKSYNRMLIKINNLKNVLKNCLEYKMRYHNLEKGVLRVKIGEEIIKITVNKEVIVDTDSKYDLDLTINQAMDILLNKKITTNNILNSWFCLDIDMYNNDLV